MKNHKKRLDWITATSTVIPKWKRAKKINDLVWKVNVWGDIGSISMITRYAKTKVSDIIYYDPKNKNYREISDLPLGMQDNFVDVEGGFVRKEAKIINDFVHKEAYENYLKWNTKPTAPGWVLMEQAEKYLKRRNLLLKYFAIPRLKMGDFCKKNYIKYRDKYSIDLPYIENWNIHSNQFSIIENMINEFKDDRAFMKEILAHVPVIFPFFPDEYQNDLEIAMTAVIWDSWNYEYISPKLKLENKQVFKIYTSKK